MGISSYNHTFTLPEAGMLLMPFDIESAVESLPVYCGSEQQASVIKYLTRFLEGGYHLEVRACPSTLQQGNSNVIAANQQYEDQISIEAGSFLTMIGGRSTAGSINPGFRVNVYDAGAQVSLTNGFIHSGSISGRIDYDPNNPIIDGATLTQNRAMFILPAPLAISSPGQLNIQIVNLATVTATIEMAFYFAVPNGTNDEPSYPANVVNAVSR